MKRSRNRRSAGRRSGAGRLGRQFTFQPNPTYARLVDKHGIDPAAEWTARVAAVATEPTLGLPMIAYRRPPQQTVLLPAMREML